MPMVQRADLEKKNRKIKNKPKIVNSEISF